MKTYTLEEALLLPAGLDLNKAIGEKVFGWDVHDYGDGVLYFVAPFGRCGPNCIHHQHILPDFSGCMFGAWELVPKLKERLGCFSLTCNPGSQWWCHDHDSSIGGVRGIGETEMLAICRAALKACWKA